MKTPVPKGYTVDELERDSPYNQWMYEDGEDFSEPEPEEEGGYCLTCSGSGEGHNEYTSCYACKGTGVQK